MNEGCVGLPNQTINQLDFTFPLESIFGEIERVRYCSAALDEYSTDVLGCNRIEVDLSLQYIEYVLICIQ